MTSEPEAMRSPLAYAAAAGLILGAVQAGLFALRGGGALGEGVPAFAGLILRVGLTGFLVGTAIWWLFVARRTPEETSAPRGVIAGALSVVMTIAMFFMVQIVSMVASGLRTDAASDVMEAAGEGALYGVAGLIVSLLRGWMDLLAAMIVGGLLVHWRRRRADAA